MRLRHIEVFHAVYSSGSMTKAARLLNVSQPSVSKVLAHAEVQLGYPLFERNGGKLQPTPEAARLFPHVDALFDSLGEVRRVARNLREAADGRVRIATTPTLGLELVPSAIAAFMRAAPGAVVEIETLHTTEIAAALREARIDLALAADAGEMAGIQRESVARGRFVLIAPRGLELPTTTYGADAIAELPLIQLNESSPLGSLLQRRFDELAITPRVVAVAETYHIASSLVANGVGVAIVDELTARSAAPSTVAVYPFEPALHFSVYLLQRDDTPLSRLGERLAAVLRAEISV